MRNPMNAAIVDRDLKPHRAASPAPKVLLYSHDTFGLGNIRRTLLLAEALGQAYPSASLLIRSEEHTSELQSLAYLVCRLLLEKKKKRINKIKIGYLKAIYFNNQ